MMKKKKQSRSQVSSPDSSPSPRLLSVIRSKLVSGKDLKNMFRGIRSKTIPGLSSQSRIVRCPNCHKLLQEPLDATSYKCGGCDSILHAKRLELEDNVITIHKALLSSQNHSLRTEVESVEDGYKSRASASSSRSKTVYKHETSNIRREWIRRADEFSTTGDTPRVPSYPASPSPSSAYEYGYNSPYHGSQVSASEQSYYHHHHHHPNQFKQGWFQEFSSASPIRSQGESDGKYYHWSSQSQLHDLQYLNLYESSSSTTRDRSVYSERSYQAPKSETSSDKNRYVRERKQVVKRHVLPSAGGAPFVTCSYCLELLQLPPQVSLHGKHKRYQVRCGSCSGVLKFSIGEKVDNVLDSPRLVDSIDETVTIDHEEMHPDDNDSGDTICKSNDHVVLSRSLETCADKRSIGESSRIHLEQSKEAHSETVAERLISHSTKPLNNNEEDVYETQVLSEQTRDTQELDWKETEKTEAYGSEEEEEIIGDKSSLDLEKSQYIEDFIYDSSSSSNNETFEDKTVKEETGHMLNTFSDVSISGEARIHGKQSQDNKLEEEFQYDYENLSQSQELDKVIADRVRYELEEDGSVVSTEKAEERLVLRQVDPRNETIESSYGTLEEVYLQGRGTWAEKEEARAGLHLEEYENYYCKPLEWTSETAPTFLNHEYELRTILEPEQDVDDRSESSSTGSFSDHKSSEENVHESQEAKQDQAQYEYENSSEIQECRYKTNETLELGSIVSLEKESETITEETSEERSVTYQRKPQENVEDSERIWEETMGDGSSGLDLEECQSNPFEWTSQRAPTFSLQDENEIEAVEVDVKMEDDESTILEERFVWTSEKAPTMLESDEDVESTSSRGSFSNHESSKVRDVFHEEPQMVEDGPSLLLEKCEEIESEKLDETFEWTAGRSLTFRLHENELDTMLKEDVDGVSESSSRSSFNEHESLNERTMNHEEVLLLVDDSETKALKVSENEAMEPRDAMFSLSPHNTLEQENMMFPLEMSQDKQSLEQGKSQEEKLVSVSSVSSQGHETSSKTAEEDSEAEEETLGEDLDHLKKENDKSRLTSKPYPPFYNTREPFEIAETMKLDESLEPRDAIFKLNPQNTLEQENMMSQEEKLESGSSVSSETSSKKAEEEAYPHLYCPPEVVGLRHALYETQTSPLTSPIHTPIGSPLHYLIRSPIPSSMHSHIVSPLRSPINSSGSLSDVLFFKLDDDRKSR